MWESIRLGQSGLGSLTLFPSARYANHLVGQVREDVDALARPVRGSRSDKLCWIAAREALVAAGLDRSLGTLSPARAGVILGSTVGGMLGTEQCFGSLLRKHPRRFGVLRFHEGAGAAELCASQLGALGPCATVSTACSAGAMAILAAAELIDQNEADLVVAGAGDSLSRLTLNGFGSLLLLDPNGCRPFDARRSGISLGEGAAMLVIEAEATARARGAPILARLAGWGASCDAYHPTAPHPDGGGALAAMRSALILGGVQPVEIDYVSAHGTGTPDNDVMEAKALRQIFRDRLPPVASVKRFFGHTLAASGALKAVLCVQALRNQAVPASPGFEATDPSIGFEPVRMFHQRSVSYILSNSFGFGGNNVALVFSRPREVHTSSHSPNEAPASVAAAGTADAAVPGLGPGGSPAGSPSMSSAGDPPGVRTREGFPVLGLGVVSAAGCSAKEVAAAFRQGEIATSWHDAPSPLPPARMRVYACAEFGAEQIGDAAKRRKLNRIQEMVLSATRAGLETAFGGSLLPEKVCIALGTGLGSLNDTMAFVENLILKEERSPRPALFSNSVHNALASRMAIEWRFTGLNGTVVQRETSFDIALWQGATELKRGRAEIALVGAADELNAHALAAGMRWGWWREQSGAIQPFKETSSGREHPLPGEGCAVLVLGRADSSRQPLAWISAIRTGRWRGKRGERLDPETEARWILETLERDGVSLRTGDMLLTGAHGRRAEDTAYCEVAEAIARLCGHSIVCGAYKHCCGEHPSASAFGLVTAIGLVRGEIAPEQCACATRPEPGQDSCRSVVLLTLSTSGTKGMCCVRA